MIRLALDLADEEGKRPSRINGSSPSARTGLAVRPSLWPDPCGYWHPGHSWAHPPNSMIDPMTTTLQTRKRVLHRAWIVAGVAFVAILGAAGFRATPGVLITPLQEEFGWSRGTISLAVSINLMLFGLTAPFAAALMDRFGMRRVVAVRAAAGRRGQRADRPDERAAGSSSSAGASWSASAPARWPWSSPPPSPNAGSSATAASSPACSPPAAPPASSSSCPSSPTWRPTRAGGSAAVTVAVAAARRGPAGLVPAARPPGGRGHHRPGRRPRRHPVVGRARTGGAARAPQRAAERRAHPALLAARRRLRDLRGEHQRPGRHPLHPGRPRPRHGRDRPPPAARPGRDLRRRRHRSRPAGSPTGSTRGSCSASTTRCAACR